MPPGYRALCTIGCCKGKGRNAFQARRWCWWREQPPGRSRGRERNGEPRETECRTSARSFAQGGQYLRAPRNGRASSAPAPPPTEVWGSCHQTEEGKRPSPAGRVPSRSRQGSSSTASGAGRVQAKGEHDRGPRPCTNGVMRPRTWKGRAPARCTSMWGRSGVDTRKPVHSKPAKTPPPAEPG